MDDGSAQRPLRQPWEARWLLPGLVLSSGFGAAALCALSGSRTAVLVWTGLVALGTAFLQGRIWLRLAEPVRLLLESTVPGALPCPESRLGPLAGLGDALARLRERERSRTAGLVALGQGLGEMAERVRAAAAEIEAGRIASAADAEETTALLAGTLTSLHGIRQEIETLARSADEAASSVVRLRGSIDDVTRSTAALHESVDSSSSSIHQIGASIRQVGEGAAGLQAMAEESAEAMTQMDRAIQQVGEHVREASVLTERVNEGAEEGSKAMAATIEGIAAIRQQTRDAMQVLERLAGRIGEIGEIVNVIGGINDETNLLSLNAAIIAAQAGEQGKAFAVVAHHVKTLAQRTASSTKEIDGLIRAVQAESANAVSAMSAGSQAVEAGVDRSRRAGQELERIRALAHEASSRVAEIMRATAEQTRNSKHVAEAARRTSGMVQQIREVMGEQSRASETLLRSAEGSLELCRQVHRCGEAQREAGRLLGSQIEGLGEQTRQVQGHAAGHAASAQAVSEAATRVLEGVRKSGGRMTPLLRRLDELGSEVRTLAAEEGDPDQAAGSASRPARATARPA